MEMIKKYLKMITLSQDKANHAFYGLLVYSIIAIWSPFVGVVVVLMLAVLKEVLDSYIGGTVDKWDVVATALAVVSLYIAVWIGKI